MNFIPVCCTQEVEARVRGIQWSVAEGEKHNGVGGGVVGTMVTNPDLCVFKEIAMHCA